MTTRAAVTCGTGVGTSIPWTVQIATCTLVVGTACLVLAASCNPFITPLIGTRIVGRGVAGSGIGKSFDQISWRHRITGDRSGNDRVTGYISGKEDDAKRSRIGRKES
jgi:hypothetical protein